MNLRKDISLRRKRDQAYTLVETLPGDKCLIRDSAGMVATVKKSWLDIGEDGICWAGSFRKSIHIQNATWGSPKE